MSDRNSQAMQRIRSAASLASVFVLVWIACSLVWLSSPLGKPVIEFQVSSSQAGFSQIFFSDKEGSFSEVDSRWSPVEAGYQVVRYPLLTRLLADGDQVRWDPLDVPAEMHVSAISLRDALRAEEIPLTSLRPSLDVGEVVIESGGASFDTQSNDPQVLITNVPRGFAAVSLVTGVVVGFVVAFSLTFLVVFLRRIRRIRQFRQLDRGHELLDSISPADRRKIAIPMWVVVSSAVVALVTVVALFVGSQTVGVSWDEPIRERALAEFLRSGWLVPRDAFFEGIPDPVAVAVYGPVALLIGQLFVVGLSDNAFWTSAVSPDAYQARHLAVAMMAIFTLVVVASIARALFRGWQWAVLAVATLGAIPLWVGHGFFNIKDVPVAAGFTAFTLALVSFGKLPRDPQPRWLTVIAAGIGVVLAIGSRPGIWLALAASLIGTFVLVLLLEARASGIRAAGIGALSRLAPVLGGVLAGFVLLWIIYPLAFSDPLQLLRASALASQSFTSGGGDTLTAGSLLATDVPWTYVPLWLGAQLPILITILAAVGAVWLAYDYVRYLLGADLGDSTVRGAIPVALQALVVPFGAVFLGATLYGGVRQILFIFPAIALLAVFGVSRTVGWSQDHRQGWLNQATWMVLVAGLVLSLISQFRLFPYNFAYFNAAASAGDVDKNWDVDGWWLSGRELVEGQQFPDRTVCVDSEKRFVSACSRMGMITPFLGEANSSVIALDEDQYVALSRFPYTVGPDSCTPFREVTRGLFSQDIQLSHADVCTATLREYPVDGISLTGLTNADPVLLWGWNPYLLWGWGAPDPDGVWMVEPEASIGFTASSLLEEVVTEVEITGSGSMFGAEGSSLRVFVNGIDSGTIPLPGDGQMQTSRVVVPEGALAELTNGRVVVRLQAEGVDPLRLESAIDSGVPGLFRIEGLALQ